MTHFCRLRTLAVSFFVIGAALLLPELCRAQLITETKVGIGLSTLWVNGADPTRSGILAGGGGYSGSQPGIGLRLRSSLGKDKVHRIPFGVDYYFLSGRERVPFRVSSLFVRHRSQALAISLGYEYEILDFNRVAKLYAGVEGRANFFLTGDYEQELVLVDGEVIQKVFRDSKEGVFRSGLALRIGVEGQFEDDVFVDASLAYTGLNLGGRDNERGYLLTPGLVPDEPEENLIGALLFGLIVMYRL